MAIYPEGTVPLPLDDVQRAANKSNELSRQGLGQNKSIYVADTAPQAEGPYVALQVVTETVFNQISFLDSPVDEAAPELYQMLDCCSDEPAPSFPVGFIFYGPIRSFTLASGSVIAYLG